MKTGAHLWSRAARERVTADGPSELAIALAAGAAATAAAGRAGDLDAADACPFVVRDFRDFFAFFRGLALLLSDAMVPTAKPQRALAK